MKDWFDRHKPKDDPAPPSDHITDAGKMIELAPAEQPHDVIVQEKSETIEKLDRLSQKLQEVKKTCPTPKKRPEIHREIM
jgi:hypothetical protein